MFAIWNETPPDPIERWRTPRAKRSLVAYRSYGEEFVAVAREAAREKG